MNNNNRGRFVIDHLKLEHFYYNTGYIYDGFPISTSVEIYCESNSHAQDYEWLKKVTHTYVKNKTSFFKKGSGYETSSYTEKIENAEDLLHKIEEYDLRKLGNNYYTKGSHEHWEVSYNSLFKIVGSYDQEVSEVEAISNLLDFKRIIEEEREKHSKFLKQDNN